MSTIKLCCLVLGDSPDERTFEVDIELNESISKLKDKIKDKKQNTFYDVDADQLDLWKVEISAIEQNEKMIMLRGNEIDVTKLEGESLNSSKMITRYFPGQPLYEHIHIIVKRPSGPLARRRYSYHEEPGQTEENLREFWKDLKNIKISDDNKFIHLSKNIYFLGDITQGSILFIRECYNILGREVLNVNNKGRWRIVGDSGVGKTFFCYYLLYLIAQRNEMVIYHRANKLPILFCKEDVLIISANELGSYSEKVWYITDDLEDDEEKISCRKIMLCSTSFQYNCKSLIFDMCPGLEKRYIPVWSWKEIESCKDKIFNDLEEEVLRELYMNQCGGIPQSILGRQSFRLILDEVDENFFDRPKFAKAFLHIYSEEPYKEYTLIFPTNCIGSKITDKLMKCCKEKLLDFINGSYKPDGFQ
ncbi:hypothetical protein RclHR1_00410020 [Rhizophagus clarus]|uniref:Crinkler (CRN) family protein, putative n=1 Tax=Rhizophagus clarus TaxID=94130 RepID=A0A2Z6RJA7_9GLOM|nr:hypothetical protein RclHR1_00410020 [Rhizophagus clarus]GES78932.1 crinkler (CRN) family protein, putative [Rhizophagus clarus]